METGENFENSLGIWVIYDQLYPLRYGPWLMSLKEYATE